MGEWTWLHALFPLADIELMSSPVSARDANVLVRTIRKLPLNDDAQVSFEVRVAPHNVAPFRGGPWLHTFAEHQLAEPGEALLAFRAKLAAAVENAKLQGR